MPHTLLLASKSFSRQLLLKIARIPFEIIEQNANEMACDWSLPLETLVQEIARVKMKGVLLDTQGSENKKIFVLTADTLSQDLSDGRVNGKPTDRQEAKEQLKRARDGSRVSTAFCLAVYKWHSGQWQFEMVAERVVTATLKFVVPDEWIDTYLDTTIGLATSNAIAIEEYGLQFLEWINGSYTTVMGLPLFEVREELEKHGFFN